MTIIEFGAKLREAREGRHWTVADVSNALKIPSRILTAIEEGSEHLPRSVYVYHFIKDYARHVGFSAEDANAMLSSLEGFDKAARPVRASSLQFTPVKPSPVPRMLGAVLKLALFAALGFGGYNAYLHFFAERNAQIVLEQKKVQQSDARSLETSSWNVPSVEKEAVLPQQGSNAKDAEHSKVSGNALTQSPVALQQPEHSNAKGIAASESAGESPQKTTQEGKITLPPDPAPQWDAPAATPPQSTFVTAAAAQDPLAEHPAYLLGQQPSSSGVGAHSGSNVLSAADSQAVPEGMHQLLVLADMGDCWMSFEPDGKKQQRMLRKGDSMTMTFRDALQLRLGNAAAVRLTYDGHEIDRSSVAKPVNMSFPPAE